ncbi:membrane protein [Gordonia phage Pherobrine]|nr:membrane protein [Gordonia phage Pherobrine]
MFDIVTVLLFVIACVVLAKVVINAIGDILDGKRGKK